MKSKTNYWYGLIPGIEKQQVIGVSKYLSETINWGADKNDLFLMLLETAIAESNTGRTEDKTPNSGMGIWQFDRGAFEDTKKYISIKRSEEFYTIISQDINDIKYEDLRKNPLIAGFFARAYFYYRIPAKIGKTTEARARQWKEYYNTRLGKGTIEGYIKKVKAFKEE